MKTAQHPDTHHPITAVADAPPQAICPHCGGQVMLRRLHHVLVGSSQSDNGGGGKTAVFAVRHLPPCAMI